MNTSVLLAIPLILACAHAALAQPELIAIDTNQGVYAVNPETGWKTGIGPQWNVGGPVSAIAYDSTSITVYLAAASGSLYATGCEIPSVELIGPFGDSAISVRSLAWNSANQTLYAISGSDLYAISTTTGAATFIASINAAGASIAGGSIAYDSTHNAMYLASSATDALYHLDLATGNATLIGPLNGPINTSGFTYASDLDTLYLVCNQTDLLFTVDRDTGASSVVGSTGPGNLNALAYVAIDCQACPGLLDCATCPPCPPDYDQNGGVDGGDIGAFFADFEAGARCADVDYDGGVTSADLAWWFMCFEQCAC